MHGVQRSVTLESKKSLASRLRRYWALYLMILPAVVAVAIFCYGPMYGVQIAFKDYNSRLGIWNSEWVGFANIKRFLNYPYFGRMMWNTLWINLFSLLFFPCSIIFAIMLNEMKALKTKKVCQMITYAPHFVSTVVVCTMVSLFLKRDGLLNIITGWFGAEPKDFLSIPSAFAPIFSLSGLWSSLGWGTILYLAGLSGVGEELVEAAKLDGASRLQIIRNIYLPHLKPVIVTQFILRMGQLLGVGFDKVFLLQNSLNLEASSVLSTYTYEVGLINGDYAYSTAISLFSNVINIVMVVIANTVSKKVSDRGLW